jgi:hypothetical protein
VAHPSEQRLLVLHALRLKGVAGTEVVAGLYGLEVDDVAKLLEDAAGRGFVRHRDGAMTGWSLTPSGRAYAAGLVAEELDRTGGTAGVEASYNSFLGLNPGLLGACTHWQLRDGGLNDHADPTYDASVVAELVAVHEQAQPLIVRLEQVLERFGCYRDRLAAALVHVQAGRGEWFTRPMIDSYHTVWFELHEDLLATLGRERASEGTCS